MDFLSYPETGHIGGPSGKGHRRTLDIGGIRRDRVISHVCYNVINQVISYWTSYRSEVNCIGPRPEAEVQYS